MKNLLILITLAFCNSTFGFVPTEDKESQKSIIVVFGKNILGNIQASQEILMGAYITEKLSEPIITCGFKTFKFENSKIKTEVAVKNDRIEVMLSGTFRGLIFIRPNSTHLTFRIKHQHIYILLDPLELKELTVEQYKKYMAQ